MTTDRLAAGDRIGDYVIEGDAPDGSYDAVHVLLPRRARLEMFVGEKSGAVRMMREACLLEALHGHPAIPRIFEVGVGSDSRPWVASELIQGESLATALGSRGTLAPMEVLALIADIAEVLTHAHDRGIVHRALRTDAIIRGTQLRIVHWNEARADANDLARAGDVYALGVIAYTALTGHLPTMPTARRCPAAPARLCLMIDDLLVANPMSRPSAAEVRARAKLILESIGDRDDAAMPLDEEPQQVELIALLNDEPTQPPQPFLRTRWTPPLGVTATPDSSQRVAIGVLKPRS